MRCHLLLEAFLIHPLPVLCTPTTQFLGIPPAEHLAHYMVIICLHICFSHQVAFWAATVSYSLPHPWCLAQCLAHQRPEQGESGTPGDSMDVRTAPWLELGQESHGSAQRKMHQKAPASSWCSTASRCSLNVGGRTSHFPAEPQFPHMENGDIHSDRLGPPRLAGRGKAWSQSL